MRARTASKRGCSRSRGGHRSSTASHGQSGTAAPAFSTFRGDRRSDLTCEPLQRVGGIAEENLVLSDREGHKLPRHETLKGGGPRAHLPDVVGYKDRNGSVTKRILRTETHGDVPSRAKRKTHVRHHELCAKGAAVTCAALAKQRFVCACKEALATQGARFRRCPGKPPGRLSPSLRINRPAHHSE